MCLKIRDDWSSWKTSNCNIFFFFSVWQQVFRHWAELASHQWADMTRKTRVTNWDETVAYTPAAHWPGCLFLSSGRSDQQTRMFVSLGERNEINLDSFIYTFVHRQSFVSCEKLKIQSLTMTVQLCFTALTVKHATTRKLCLYCGASPARQRRHSKETALSAMWRPLQGKPHLFHQLTHPVRE